MKANTSKLYEKMKPRELAAIYHKTYDTHERDKIAATVPRYDYRAIDHEFIDHVGALKLITLWWIAEYWKTTAKLNEELNELSHYQGEKTIANLYLSRLKAFESALIEFDLEHIKEVAEVSVDADGLMMVYELELLPDYLDKFTDNIVNIMEDALAA